MTRKFILMSVILIFVITPLIAWGIVTSQYAAEPANKVPDIKVTPATKADLLKVATTKSKAGHVSDNSDIKVTSIVSYQNLNTWWYIAQVKYASFGKENPVASPMLLVKYYDGPDSIRIVTNPGESLPFYNISDSSGVPYEVIDKYNKAISASEPDLGED